MRECLRGWRRKIGVMTLVIACVFAIAWVRSVTTLDVCTFQGGWLHSSEGTIHYLWFDMSKFTPIEVGNDHIAVLHATGLPLKRIAIPYWWIVTPLTLLSACLLLSKPRVAKPPEPTKPPDEAQVTHA